MTEATQRTSDNGVSIWLDDLSRTRIESGSLQELIKDKNVVIHWYVFAKKMVVTNVIPITISNVACVNSMR